MVVSGVDRADAAGVKKPQVQGVLVVVEDVLALAKQSTLDAPADVREVGGVSPKQTRVVVGAAL